VAAEGALNAASVRTGIAQRDGHLRGPNFFHADRHPYIGLRALRFEPADDGWIVPAVLSVGGAETPVTLHARRLPDPAPGAIAVRITGEFDRTTTRIRAPRLVVGHRIAMEAELSFTRR
jgi:polyisoprenoid-binding protein YceI